MNWKEKLRKECEHLNEVSDFLFVLCYADTAG